jgi:Cu2+-exporting ATPase
VSVVELAREDAASPAGSCLHCHLPTAAGRQFCCPGCAAAYETIQALGLGRYYAQRVLDPALRVLRPEVAEARDVARYVATRTDGSHELTLAVDGLQCGACVWLIESVLAREPDVLEGRVNLTTRRLRLVWRGLAAHADTFVETIEGLGYRLVPFSAEALAAAQDTTGGALLRALAVAGFAAGNVMLLSIGVWAGATDATRDLLHWVSALIALPAIAYAGRPFFRSAWAVLRCGRTNMDVPISLGVVLVTCMSLIQTMQGGEDTYFDSACALLFFLLIGRLMDHRARGQARATAEQLLMLRAADVAVVRDDGHVERRGQERVAVGDRVLVGMGERVGVDGVVERGASLLDASLVTGESQPVPVMPGTEVFAGTLNLGEVLTVRAIATGGGTLLAECVRLIEAAEARRSRFVVLADRVARRYAPAVHLTALATFLWWYFVAGVTVGVALLTASAVLIITCPCALALAVPVVQVIATGRLFRSGVLLKSPTALERLADVDTVVFDKTGTLTEPVLALERGPEFDDDALQVAASLAVASRHPLARSLVAAAGPVAMAEGAVEVPGQGVRAGEVRLGNRQFAIDGRVKPGHDGTGGPELWLAWPGREAVRFGFVETLRMDAAVTVERLRTLGLEVHLLSGDRAISVASVARAIGIGVWQAEQTPVKKVAAVEALVAAGRKVLMVGDGLNDGPSLAAATVSASPATAADVSQTVADVVFQSAKLAPVASVIETARQARGVMRQNLALSIGYNVLMVPLAVAGLVTPWLAAAAMSSSSLVVMLNSCRLRGRAA